MFDLINNVCIFALKPVDSQDRSKILEFIKQMNGYIKCNANAWKPRTNSDQHYVLFKDGEG